MTAKAWRVQEAQKAQPSIIFFDEIDGLAPVRVTGLCVINTVLELWLMMLDGLH